LVRPAFEAVNLRGKSLVHAVGALAYALSQWLVLTFCARLISIEAAGLYAYYLALFVPAATLFSFGLRNSIASDSASEYPHGVYFRAQVFGVFLLLVWSVIVLLFWGDSREIAFLVFSIKAIELWTEVPNGFWVKNGEAQRYGYSKALRLIAFLLLFSAAYVSGVTNIHALYAYPVAMLLVIFFYDRRYFDPDLNGASSISTSQVWSVIRKSSPLALGAFLIGLNASVPRLVLKALEGERSIASYVMLTYFCSLAIIPISSICQAYTPYFSGQRELHVRKERFAKLLGMVVLAAMGFFIGMLLFANIFVKVVYELNDGLSIIDISLVALGGGFQFVGTVANAYIVAQRRFGVLFRSTCVVLVLNVISIIPLVIMLGPRGAFVGFFMNSTVMAVIVFWQVHKMNLK
jgi:lipopolysaccharide exporter